MTTDKKSKNAGIYAAAFLATALTLASPTAEAGRKGGGGFGFGLNPLDITNCINVFSPWCKGDKEDKKKEEQPDTPGATPDTQHTYPQGGDELKHVSAGGLLLTLGGIFVAVAGISAYNERRDKKREQDEYKRFMDYAHKANKILKKGRQPPNDPGPQ